MTKAAAVVTTSLLAVACADMVRPGFQEYSRHALALCRQEAEGRAIDLADPAMNRVYVYVMADAAWLYFSHGDPGTSGERSADYKLLLVCGVQNRPPTNVVFMGQPLEDPVVDNAGRDNFLSPAGTTEVLFKRVDGSFEYCCSRKFED